jgi:hypothetical protein
MLSVRYKPFVLSVLFAECHYAERRYAVCRYAQRRGTV